MIEHRVRIITEGLARAIDRRSFLKKAGGTAFAGVAALAAGQLFASGASAKESSERPNLVPNCAPPGPYCNINGLNEPNGCHGGSCFQHLVSGTIYQCRVYYTFYQAGCWTTASTGGYWTCCDCQCTNGSTCGCAQFSATPIPRPDGPGGTKAT